jgi:multisubunit Na+/H+ antiporter MnhE subunit
VVIGSALGVLIGIVTGTVFLLILRAARHASEKGRSSILTFTGQLLALPTFWFGGPWLTGTLLKDVLLKEAEPANFIQGYLLALIVAFALFSLYPAARWIIQIGEEFGRAP